MRTKKMTDIIFILIIIGLVVLSVGLFVQIGINEQRSEEQRIMLKERLQEERAARNVAEARAKFLEFKLNAYKGEYVSLNSDEETQEAQKTEIKDDPIEKSKTETAKKERLPEGATNMFMCMDFRKITNTRSDQYKLQQECETSEKTGIRLYCGKGEDMTEYYCAALGSAYGRDIGDTWLVTLDNGAEFNIILADFKDDGSTDFFGHPCRNYEGEDCTNVIEFVVGMENVPEKVKQLGTMSALDWCDGNIVDMEYTGRAWEGAEE